MQTGFGVWGGGGEGGGLSTLRDLLVFFSFEGFFNTFFPPVWGGAPFFPSFNWKVGFLALVFGWGPRAFFVPQIRVFFTPLKKNNPIGGFVVWAPVFGVGAHFLGGG